MGNSSKSTFLHQRELELWDSYDLPNFPPVYQNFVRNFAFFCSFCEVFTLCGPRQNVCKLTIIQPSTVPHNSVQISPTPKRLICGIVPFWKTKRVSLNFAIRKFPTPEFPQFTSPRSISSTMQGILLRESTDLKKEGRRSFA